MSAADRTPSGQQDGLIPFQAPELRRVERLLTHEFLPEYLESLDTLGEYLQSTRLMDAIASVLEGLLAHPDRDSNPIQWVATQLSRASTKYANFQIRKVQLEVPKSPSSAQRTPARLEVTAESKVLSKDYVETVMHGHRWQRVGSHALFGIDAPALSDLAALFKQLKEQEFDAAKVVFLLHGETLFVNGYPFVSNGCKLLSAEVGRALDLNFVSRLVRDRLVAESSRGATKCILLEELSQMEVGVNLEVTAIPFEQRQVLNFDTIQVFTDFAAAVIGKEDGSAHRRALVFVSFGCFRSLNTAMTAAATFFEARSKVECVARIRRAEVADVLLKTEASDEMNVKSYFQRESERHSKLCSRREARDSERHRRIDGIRRVFIDPSCEASEEEREAAKHSLEAWDAAESKRSARRVKEKTFYDHLERTHLLRASMRIQALVRGWLVRRDFIAMQRATVSLKGRETEVAPETRYLHEANYAIVRLVMQDLVRSYKDALMAENSLPLPVPKQLSRWNQALRRIPPPFEDDLSSEEETWEQTFVEARSQQTLLPRHKKINPATIALSAMEDGGCDDRAFLFNSKYLHHGIETIQKRATVMLRQIVVFVTNAAYSALRCSGHPAVKGKTLLQWIDESHAKIIRLQRCIPFCGMSTPFSGIPLLSCGGPQIFDPSWLIVVDDFEAAPFFTPWVRCDSEAEPWEQEFAQREGEQLHPAIHQMSEDLPLFFYHDSIPAPLWRRFLSHLQQHRVPRICIASTKPYPTVYVNGVPHSLVMRSRFHHEDPQRRRNEMCGNAVACLGSASTTPRCTSLAATPPPSSQRSSSRQSSSLRDKPRFVLHDRPWLGVSWSEMERRLCERLRLQVESDDGTLGRYCPRAEDFRSGETDLEICALQEDEHRLMKPRKVKSMQNPFLKSRSQQSLDAGTGSATASEFDSKARRQTRNFFEPHQPSHATTHPRPFHGVSTQGAQRDGTSHSLKERRNKSLARDTSDEASLSITLSELPQSSEGIFQTHAALLSNEVFRMNEENELQPLEVCYHRMPLVRGTEEFVDALDYARFCTAEFFAADGDGCESVLAIGISSRKELFLAVGFLVSYLVDIHDDSAGPFLTPFTRIADAVRQAAEELGSGLVQGSEAKRRSSRLLKNGCMGSMDERHATFTDPLAMLYPGMCPLPCLDAFVSVCDSNGTMGLRDSMKFVDAILIRCCLRHVLRRPIDQACALAADTEKSRAASQGLKRSMTLNAVRALEQYSLLVFFHNFLTSKWRKATPDASFGEFLSSHTVLLDWVRHPDPFVAPSGPVRSLDPFHVSYTNRLVRWGSTYADSLC